MDLATSLVVTYFDVKRRKGLAYFQEYFIKTGASEIYILQKRYWYPLLLATAA